MHLQYLGKWPINDQDQKIPNEPTQHQNKKNHFSLILKYLRLNNRKHIYLEWLSSMTMANRNKSLKSNLPKHLRLKMTMISWCDDLQLINSKLHMLVDLLNQCYSLRELIHIKFIYGCFPPSLPYFVSGCFSLSCFFVPLRLSAASMLQYTFWFN